ncbi:alanyl-tRNA editing protein [Geotoga petraea]|uniref:Alanyl-tRNA editing protein n=1 Tax=Geotoga petraea TaxID=28234 RepID=A0A4Z0W5B4_9BACT|nr:alanyl-tRNA editing protein [Geotoga petraea]TGG88217.1 alanyl-tRNA editing protein [Geotoga petraea]
MKIKVLTVKNQKDSYKAILESNPLYPDGKGGQLGDRGKVQNSNIIFVGKDYILTDNPIETGEIEVNLDLKNREDIAKQHTAQHLLSAILKDHHDLNTVGFRMSENYSTIDIDKRVTQQLIEEIEYKSNQIINEDLKVFEKTYSQDETHKLNLRKGISKKITGDVRVIYIDNLDASACGGFHVKSTLEINMIKIIKTENIKNEYMRIYYLAGKRVFNYFKELEKITNDLGNLLKTNKEDFTLKVSKLIEENDLQKKELESLYSYKAENILSNLKPIEIFGNIKIFFLEKKDNSFEYVQKSFDKNNFLFILKDEDTYKIQSDVINVGNLIKIINNKYSTKGGGGKTNGQIKGNLKLEDILQYIK